MSGRGVYLSQVLSFSQNKRKTNNGAGWGPGFVPFTSPHRRFANDDTPDIACRYNMGAGASGAAGSKQASTPSAQEIFDAIDEDKSGQLTVAELSAAAKTHADKTRIKWTADRIEREKHCRSGIQYTRTAMVCRPLLRRAQSSVLRIESLFAKLDADGDGLLDPTEFGSGMAEIFGPPERVNRRGNRRGARQQQAAMLEEAKRASAAAAASLEAVGMTGPAKEPAGEASENTRRDEINAKVLADLESEREAAAQATAIEEAKSDAMKQIEVRRLRREEAAAAAAQEAAEEAAAAEAAAAAAEAAEAEEAAAAKKEARIEAIEAKKASKQKEVQEQRQVAADKKAMAEIEKAAKKQALKELRTGEAAQQISEARKAREEAEKQLADMEEREEDEKQQREFDEAMRKAQRQSRAIESKLGMVAAEQTLVAAE